MFEYHHHQIIIMTRLQIFVGFSWWCWRLHQLLAGWQWLLWWACSVINVIISVIVIVNTIVIIIITIIIIMFRGGHLPVGQRGPFHIHSVGRGGTQQQWRWGGDDQYVNKDVSLMMMMLTMIMTTIKWFRRGEVKWKLWCVDFSVKALTLCNTLLSRIVLPWAAVALTTGLTWTVRKGGNTTKWLLLSVVTGTTISETTTTTRALLPHFQGPQQWDALCRLRE